MVLEDVNFWPFACKSTIDFYHDETFGVFGCFHESGPMKFGETT